MTPQNKINNKLEKIALFLTILGIFLLIVRIIFYTAFLGSFLDLLWVLTFVLVIYVQKNRYIYTIIPLLLGYSFEFFQLITKIAGINNGGYYPGTADIKDVFAYTIGYIIGLLIIIIVSKKIENEKV